MDATELFLEIARAVEEQLVEESTCTTRQVAQRVSKKTGLDEDALFPAVVAVHDLVEIAKSFTPGSKAPRA